jgi:sortase A
MTRVPIRHAPEEICQVAVTRPRCRGWLRTLSRGVGQTLVTFGVIGLLLVVYQLWVADLFTAREQHQLAQHVERQWEQVPTVTTTRAAPTADRQAGVGIGEPFALIHIPRLHGDWAVVEGVARAQLAHGPGHYVGTAMPGEQGNFAVAGHAMRSVFLRIGDLRPGDPIVVETAESWFVYRVLGDPLTGSFHGDPSGVPGQEVVLPTAVEVLSATPDGPPGRPPSGAYLTLTTCTPAITATHRLVVHARLDVPPISKAASPGGPPALRG